MQAVIQLNTMGTENPRGNVDCDGALVELLKLPFENHLVLSDSLVSFPCVACRGTCFAEGFPTGVCEVLLFVAGA